MRCHTRTWRLTHDLVFPKAVCGRERGDAARNDEVVCRVERDGAQHKLAGGVAGGGQDAAAREHGRQKVGVVMRAR